HRTIMMFKAWLRGIHHSVDNLQGYLDQYCYRFNRSNMKSGIFDNLLAKMVDHKPCPYKVICIY
ncbi:MAG: IS1595 family transposase, partial [Bacteroidetes bacterium]|nr:IS1595 family transposase [Bacteroidota bacterium]